MATLTVTIKEELTLNGVERGNTNVSSFTSVDECDHRVVAITNAEKTLLLFASTIEAGTFKNATLEYLRITNLDSAATVDLRVRDAAQEFMVRVNPGGSFILTEDKLDADATGSDETTSLAQIVSIKAVSSASSSSVEIFAAG